MRLRSPERPHAMGGDVFGDRPKAKPRERDRDRDRPKFKRRQKNPFHKQSLGDELENPETNGVRVRDRACMRACINGRRAHESVPPQPPRSTQPVLLVQVEPPWPS